MRIPHVLTKTLLGGAFMCLLVTGCKKEEEPTPTPVTPADQTGTTQQTQRASDQSNVDNESGQAMDEANNILMEVSTTRDVQTYCNLTIDSSQKSIGKITVTYSGNDCYNTKSRTGTIVIELPYDPNTATITRWHEQGCVAKLTFIDYKVTNLSTNKSLEFDGVHTIKNESGGGLLQLYLGQSIEHVIRANMNLTFDDGTTRTWHAAKRRIFNYSSGQLKVEIKGDTAVGPHAHVAMWGVTRLGDDFTLDVPTPITYYLLGTSCLYKPKGAIVIYGPANSLSVTYGVDSNGLTTTSCPFGYKFNWTDSQGTPHEVIQPY